MAARRELIRVLQGYRMTLAETLGLIETLKFEVLVTSMSSREFMQKLRNDLRPDGT
jgi:hypothetical protein